MYEGRFHQWIKRILLASGLPFAAIVIGWFFGALCSTSFMLLGSGVTPDFEQILWSLFFSFLGALFHPSFWIYCGLAAAWAGITKECEPHFEIFIDFLLFALLVIIFGLSFSVRILEPNFVEDFQEWIIIIFFGGATVGLSVLVRKFLASLPGQDG